MLSDESADNLQLMLHNLIRCAQLIYTISARNAIGEKILINISGKSAKFIQVGKEVGLFDPPHPPMATVCETRLRWLGKTLGKYFWIEPGIIFSVWLSE
jgi:hypothetical protein